MKLLRVTTLVLLSGMLFTLALPSCQVDEPDTDAISSAGRGGSSGAAGKGPNGGAGKGSSTGGASSTFGRGGAGKGGANEGGMGTGDTGTGDTGHGGTTTDAGAAGEGPIASGGTGTAVGQAGVGASSGEGGETARGGGAGRAGNGGAGLAGNGGTGGSRACTVITELDVQPGYADGAVAAVRAEMLPPFGNTEIEDDVQFNVIAARGGAEVGTFELGTGIDVNYATCARCLFAFQDISGRRYFATAGTLTFEADSLQLAGLPHGTLRDVTLREVTSDLLTLVAGGRCITIADADGLVNRLPPPLPSGWVCDVDWYNDGTCDCGCGALDADCESESADVCVYCSCANGDCSLVRPMENHLCDAPVSPCTALTGFGDLGIDTSSPGVVTFSAPALPNLGDALPDVLSLSVSSGEVGTFELGTGIDADLATCARCLTVRQDGDAKRYFATEGTLTFNADSLQMDGLPKGTLRNVMLREVQLDSDASSHSSVVPDGSCLTVENADVVVNTAPPGWVNCPASYYADGGCDCGCGAVDADCATSNAEDCEYCFCQGDSGWCTDSSVNPTNNGVCE